MQVALLGAAGGIGQPLGLLLKMNKLVGELSLYDVAPVTPGVAKDLSHCNTPSTVPLRAPAPAHTCLSCVRPAYTAVSPATMFGASDSCNHAGLGSCTNAASSLLPHALQRCMTSCMAQPPLVWRSVFLQEDDQSMLLGRILQAVGFTGPENLGKALEGADLVVIPAGVPRKPGAPDAPRTHVHARSAGFPLDISYVRRGVPDHSEGTIMTCSCALNLSSN